MLVSDWLKGQCLVLLVRMVCALRAAKSWKKWNKLRVSNKGDLNPPSNHYLWLNPVIPSQSECSSLSHLVKVKSQFCPEPAIFSLSSRLLLEEELLSRILQLRFVIPHPAFMFTLIPHPAKPMLDPQLGFRCATKLKAKFSCDQINSYEPALKPGISE